MGGATMITVTHHAITCRPRSRATIRRPNTTIATTTASCNRTLAGMATVIATTPATINNSAMMCCVMPSAVVVIDAKVGVMSARAGSGSATDDRF